MGPALENTRARQETITRYMRIWPQPCGAVNDNGYLDISISTTPPVRGIQLISQHVEERQANLENLVEFRDTAPISPIPNERLNFDTA